jgi:hypothetical protein
MQILFCLVFSIFTISTLPFKVTAAPGDDSRDQKKVSDEGASSSKEENKTIVGAWRVSECKTPSITASFLIYFSSGSYDNLRIKTRSGLVCESKKGTWGTLYVLNGYPTIQTKDSDCQKRTSRKKRQGKSKRQNNINMNDITLRNRGVWYHPGDNDEMKNVLWELTKIEGTSIKPNLPDLTPKDGKEIPLDGFIFNMTKINKLSSKAFVYDEMDMRKRSDAIKVFNSYQAEKIDLILTEDQIDALPDVKSKWDQTEILVWEALNQ